ncbi:uncharacterized protein LOC118313196 isoform X2 [Scophthalmus maximus]|uniref:uncharacterized protein LOC118313196 isoform X2 n=1 Tax=Scophthalmus maximus TaxID=52904 RepID=UPI001FA8B498|nr:uncharacterized protein LOC118313196 isoform X2 [Scophthalmus maximus]
MKPTGTALYTTQNMQRRRRVNPKEDATFYITAGRDKVALDIKYINAIKGRGIFTSAPFEKGDFLVEYRGELITKQECERRQRVYHDHLKVFMFEFHFNGKLWCVDASTEDGSFGRVVNDDHLNPNARMKYFTVKGKPHLCLFAVRDIGPGEEITYNYGDSNWPWRCKNPGKSLETINGEGPPTSKPCTSEKDVDEDTSQRGCEATNCPSSSEDVEEMMAEGSPNKLAASSMNLPSPLLDPLGKVEKFVDEDTSQRGCEATNCPSSSEDVEEMMAEGSPNKLAAISMNLPSPVLDPLGKVEKYVDEDTSQRGCEATNCPSSSEDVEEMMAEGSPNLLAASSMNLPSPVLDPLGKVEKYVDEDTSQRGCEATNCPSSSEDVEEMMAEGSPNKLAAIYWNLPSPVLGPLGKIEKLTTETNQNQLTSPNETDTVFNSEKCCKHRLVCTTVSSLDRCVQCVGPVSAFKWLGYRCRVCSGVWHKSCLRQITTDYIQDPSQQKFPRSSGDELLSDEDDLPHSELNQILDDDDYVSDMDYVPNSDSHDDDDDYSDASIHLMPRLLKATQIQEKVVKPDVGTSDASDTNILVVPSTSKHPPLEDPMEVASDSGNSIKDSSRDPEGKGELHEQDLPHLIFSKKNYCYICGKPQSKISRHLRTHKTHAEVVRAFSLPEDSKERKTILEKMRNKGNFQHNTEVLQGGTGPVKVKRKPKAKSQPGKFIHCMHCQGMYIRKELWRHVRRCPFKPENQDLDKEPGRTKVLALAAAHESAFSQQISSGVWKLLGVMKQDEIASIVRNDLSIIQFAQSLYNKHGQDPTKHEYLRQKLREVGRLLLCLRTDFSVQNLEEAVKPANFQRVVQAVKKVAGFDEEKASYLTPSLALKLGHALQKICDIVHCRALMAEDQELIRSTEIFKKLQMSKWSELVSHRALNTLSDAKYNKPSTLPFTEDVQTLHRYLDKSAESSFCNLKETATTQNYAQLAKVTLAQIIVFNRRRAGEVSKMRLKSFHERDNTKLHDDVAMGLSKTEKRLCNYFSRIEIMGKRGRKVAVLLTPRMVDALSLLVSNRAECDVCATNVFLFARPKSMSYYRGQDCLRVHASQCGAKHPEYLRSTHLRKHVATLSQVLNLKNNELDQVADFLGHDIRVHRDFYRLPVPTTQLAKISKLLLSMEKGDLSSMQGRSLDEIEIEEEIAVSDAEAKDRESEPESDEAGCGTSKPVDDADSTFTAAEMVSAVSSTVIETAPPSEGKVDHREAGARRLCPKRVWIKAEVAAVMRYFSKQIKEGKLATKAECSHCKEVEGPVLAERTVQNIRDFVRNRGRAAKRQQQKL